MANNSKLATFAAILQKEPLDLLDWLFTEFNVPVIPKIASIEDMDTAAKQLIQLSSYNMYLLELLSYAKIATREAKRSKIKEDYEDMVDRKDAIQNMVSAISQQYSGLSRAVTIHVENNRELTMLKGM